MKTRQFYFSSKVKEVKNITRTVFIEKLIFLSSNISLMETPCPSGTFMM